MALLLLETVLCHTSLKVLIVPGPSVVLVP